MLFFDTSGILNVNSFNLLFGRKPLSPAQKVKSPSYKVSKVGGAREGEGKGSDIFT